jgi:serine/threonine-protein kinase
VGKRSIKGKFPYLAPEILENADPSPASDVYSAGLVLHELLVGRNEFAAKGMPAIVSRVLKHTPTPVDMLRDDVPPGLGPLISKALAKAPADRYASAAEFAEALSNVRRLTEDEAAKQLATLASADFRDERMSKFLSVPELDELESDWRTPASSLSDLTDPDLGVAEAVEMGFEDTAAGADAVDDAEPHANTDPAPKGKGERAHARKRPETLERTVAGSPAALSGTNRGTSPGTNRGTDRGTGTGRVEPRARSIWPTALAVAALGAVAAVSIAALLKAGDKNEGPTEPAYIVMSDRDKEAPPPNNGIKSMPLVVADAGTTAAERPPERPPEKPPEKPPHTPAETSARQLTRAFGKQKGKVARCFERHASELSGAPEMSIRFRVKKDGSVTKAELSPPALRPTDLGKCVEKVARATKFGRQPKDVTFRVPLKARVRQ